MNESKQDPSGEPLEVAQLLQNRLQEGFQRQIWSIENRQTFYAQTTPWMFAQWMIVNTGSFRVNTDTGFYNLSSAYARPRPSPDHVGPITVEINGSHDREDSEESVHYAGLCSSLITFAVQPVGSERVQIRAECRIPELGHYFQVLLHSIGEAFGVPALIDKPANVINGERVQDVSQETTPKAQPESKPPGRQRGPKGDDENHWAREQVCYGNRTMDDILPKYKELRQLRIGPAAYKDDKYDTDNPAESLRKALSPKRKMRRSEEEYRKDRNHWVKKIEEESNEADDSYDY